MLYLILIVVMIFSYRILEDILEKLFPDLGKDQLWATEGYYLWGLVLFIIYFIVKPNDYIMKIPINNKNGIMFILAFMISTIFICIKDSNVYYPKKTNKLKCFHYGVVQPIFEEIAFRGLILPMTIYLLGNSFSGAILLNGIIFMLFHLNYWSFKKKTANMFLGFLALGLCFSYITVMTQSIIYSILCHIIINGGNTLYRNFNVKVKV